MSFIYLCSHLNGLLESGKSSKAHQLFPLLMLAETAISLLFSLASSLQVSGDQTWMLCWFWRVVDVGLWF